ncbi:apoptosis facilitator Bcl-2-like protein 14 isoform X1 [Alosa sapidissima]|uniref:apoptosis facilitator Bcl-2-like protein 14 isoform X1 n=2 Tax=Alosa sapidissima TaxID=34773 RepID=UPI001C09E622|nr:apoptosis facilitator Bcl-2-like protein 14 isoform X1 [Alosa sapidissima]
MAATESALKETHEPMANGHTGEEVGMGPGAPEDSMELRILMAYAKKRRPSDKRLQCQLSITKPSVTPSATTEANNDSQNTPPKKKWYRKLPSCLRSKTKDPDLQPDLSDDDSRPQPASLSPSTGDKVAGKLTQLSTAVPFLQGDLETDCPEDIAQELAKLLRDSGDELNEKIKNDKALHDRLVRSFDYGLFSRITTAFLGKLNLSSAQSEEEAQIAMTCEVVTRLSTMDTLPVSQTMGFGACYLKDYFSPWVQQHGGWDKVFESDEEQD